MRTIISILLSLLVALFILLVYFIFLNENPGPAGITHETFPSMLRSTDSYSDTTAIFFGSFFGILSIIVFVLFLFIGIRQKENSKLKVRVWIIGLIIYLGIFIFGLIEYMSYTNSNTIKLFLGFPRPTAWMLFGIYLYPLFFTFYYVIKFKYWVISDEKERMFKDLCDKSSRT